VPLSDSDTRKCQRCGVYYAGNENTSQSCVYHSGHHTNLKYDPCWTCCHEPEKTAPGCCKGHHIEDPVTSQLLATRPVAVGTDITVAQPPEPIIEKKKLLNKVQKKRKQTFILKKQMDLFI